MGLRRDSGGAGNLETYGWAEYVRTRRRPYGLTDDGPGGRAGERRPTDGPTLKKNWGTEETDQGRILGYIGGRGDGGRADMGAGVRG